MNLKKFFPFLYRTEWNVKPGHEVKKAFSSNGVDYYCFENGLHVYYERFMAAQDAVNQLEQRVDRKYLELHVQLTREYTRKGHLDQIAILNRNLEERMNHLCNVDLLYQLAAVWYFDKSENCYAYNPEYAERKIAQWRKDKEVLNFFLTTPLGRFLPFSDTFTPDMLPTYTRAQRLELKSVLSYHLSQLPETKENSGLRSTINLHLANLELMLQE